MECFKEQYQKFKKLHSSLQHNSVCLSTMRRKRRLKYIVAIGKHGFAVKSRHPTEAMNLIAYLGCLLRMDYCLVAPKHDSIPKDHKYALNSRRVNWKLLVQFRKAYMIITLRGIILSISAIPPGNCEKGITTLITISVREQNTLGTVQDRYQLKFCKCL